MRVFACILLALLCATATGCSLFKKNSNQPAAGPDGGPAPPKFPGSRDPLIPAAPPPKFPDTSKAKDSGSILAGTVVDAYHRPMSNAYIRWVNLTDKDTGAPIDVAADANGHFIIQGVKPGGSYKLIARTKQGDKMLAGTVLTSAPDVRVVIPIREDLVTADTPPMPTSPAYANPEKPAQTEGKITPNGSMETPVLKVPSAPKDTTVGNPATIPEAPAFVPGVVEAPFKDRLPMLTVPNGNPPKKLEPTRPPSPPALPFDSKLDTGPTRVPSCVLVGNHLENLALKDSRGHTWEYRKHAAGKLVLIDFWGTHCIYCRDSMPALTRLQKQYGTSGLEVIGIAIEAGKDERRESEAVNKLCTSLHVGYRQLMGRSGTFDASKQFKIDGLPTLMLLSESGDVIYHHVGRPEAADLSTLERIIQGRLNSRPF